MSDDHAGAEREVRRAVREIHAAVIPMVDNIHRDVHHVRQDFREAIERSETAVLNKLSLLEAKIDKLTPSGDVVTEADKSLMAASLAKFRGVIDKAKALDEMTA